MSFPRADRRVWPAHCCPHIIIFLFVAFMIIYFFYRESSMTVLWWTWLGLRCDISPVIMRLRLTSGGVKDMIFFCVRSLLPSFCMLFDRASFRACTGFVRNMRALSLMWSRISTDKSEPGRRSDDKLFGALGSRASRARSRVRRIIHICARHTFRGA